MTTLEKQQAAAAHRAQALTAAALFQAADALYGQHVAASAPGATPPPSMPETGDPAATAFLASVAVDRAAAGVAAIEADADRVEAEARRLLAAIVAPPSVAMADDDDKEDKAFTCEDDECKRAKSSWICGDCGRVNAGSCTVCECGTAKD